MRSTVRVLDSYSRIALSVVNWGEVYYIALREAGAQRADEVAHVLSTLPIHIVHPDLELTKQAAL